MNTNFSQRDGDFSKRPSHRRIIRFGVALAVSLLLALPVRAAAKTPWIAIHVLNVGTDDALDSFREQVPRLAELGVNTIILEVDYGFEFQSHPELRGNQTPITRAGAGRMADACRAKGIRLIPQFQCLGHQSWSSNTFSLLTKYPELDLTPNAFPGNKGLYCREWDPLNPRVNEIVFPLLGELIDAFHADALHAGMDEVFLIGSKESPSTFGKNPAEVFAKAVNDIHGYLVKQRKVEMLMWADRLIDASQIKYGKWEASAAGTAPAIDMIPKDIIMCDWHYEKRADGYPSVPMFLEKGFRLLPTSWKNVEACEAFIRKRLDKKHDRMLGHLFTNWSGRRNQYPEFPPLLAGVKLLQPAEAAATGAAKP